MQAMRRAMCWLVLSTVSMAAAGCGSSAIEPGMPADVGPLDYSKSDPMLNPSRNDPISQKTAKKAARKAH
jgi:hypothetical protein